MEQLIKDFAAKLKATLPTVVVRPALGKDYQLPAAVYSTRNGMRDLFYKDSFGTRTTEFTVIIYSKSYDEIQTLKTLVVDEFHGFTGLMGSTKIDSINVVNILDGYDTNLETVHKVIFTMNVLD